MLAAASVHWLQDKDNSLPRHVDSFSISKMTVPFVSPGFGLVFVVGRVEASMFKMFRFLLRKKGRGMAMQSSVSKRICGN